MPKNALYCIDDYENYAISNLPKSALDFYRGGSEYEHTLRLNREAFKKFRIRPRVLVDVSKVTTATTVLGSKVSMPIGIAPMGMQGMADPNGECASARAAGVVGTVFTLSTLSNNSIEEVAAAAPLTIKWFQLYILSDRDFTKTLVQRAEKSGYKAVVLTVDVPVMSIRYANDRNNFVLPPHLGLNNLDDEKSKILNVNEEGQSSLGPCTQSLLDNKLTWGDIQWLKSITNLPIVVKGILTAEDATIAADLGVAAIQVSNHGGRQLDSTPASIEALQEVVKAVGHKCEVFFDSGVRSGTDVLKAIALGAKMVFVGRPTLWGLAHDGQSGVENVFKILEKEFHSAMGLAGCTSVGDINNSKRLVVHENFYSCSCRVSSN